MNIKKLIAGSMFSMLLVSEMAAADWGDVYYCQMTNFSLITVEGEKENYKLAKFQFKLDKTKNAMVFGSTGYLSDQVIELVGTWNLPSQERWDANDAYSVINFNDGSFLFASVSFLGISSILADCEKF